MEQSKKRDTAAVEPGKRSGTGPRSNTLFFVAVGTAVVLALILLWWTDSGPRGNDLQKLVGRWQRTDPDGKFILDVRKVSGDGTAEVRYFNPSPINVSTARAGMDDSPELFVELRDTNYPGCTYSLRYDPAIDELVGVYYQANEQQNYDVAFKRKPPGTD